MFCARTTHAGIAIIVLFPHPSRAAMLLVEL
jgi:hypothetical protein